MNRKQQINQAGMVAIIVTMIMMFVITLIVLGFSQVTRRNQRESVDTQLGIQAYYAAESGVNDVAKAGGTVPSNDKCDTANPNGHTYPRNLKADGSVATTCLMVNANPTSLIVDKINHTSDSVQWDVKSAGGAFTSLKFAWSPSSPTASGACASAVGTYPKASNWMCTHALLRVDIVDANTATDAVSLANATKTLYLKPSSSSTSPIVGPSSAYQAGCKPDTTAQHICAVTINLSGPASADHYYVRLTSLYATATNVTLTGTDATGPVKFVGGQIVVDSTGRAQDQVKRIRVRIPVNGVAAQQPIFAVQGTDDICKDLKVAAPSLYDKGACTAIWP